MAWHRHPSSSKVLDRESSNGNMVFCVKPKKILLGGGMERKLCRDTTLTNLDRALGSRSLMLHDRPHYNA